MVLLRRGTTARRASRARLAVLIGGVAAAWVVMLPPEHVEHTDHRESKRPGKHGSTEHHLELRELVEHHEPGAHAEEPHVPKHAAIHEGYQPGSGTRG